MKLVNANKERQNRKAAMLTDVDDIVEVRYKESEEQIEFYSNYGFLGSTKSKQRIKGFALVRKVESLFKGIHFTLEYSPALTKKDFDEENVIKEEIIKSRIDNRQASEELKMGSYEELNSVSWIEPNLENIGDLIEFLNNERHDNSGNELDNLIDKILDDNNTINYLETINYGRKIIELLKNNIQITKDVKSVSNVIVSAHLNNNELENATLWVDELIKYGHNLYHIKNKLVSLKNLQGGLNLNDIRNNRTLNSIGKLYRELKAYLKAREVYERALKLEPRNTYTLTQLGRLCKDAKWLSDGIMYYEQSLNIRMDIFPLNGLGAIYRECENFDSAIEAYYTSLNINPDDNPYAHKGLGAVYIDLRLYSEANYHFELAGTSSINYLYDELEKYKNLNLIDDAIKCLEQILEINPNDINAKEELFKYRKKN